jgi:hypothetical protein
MYAHLCWLNPEILKYYIGKRCLQLQQRKRVEIYDGTDEVDKFQNERED